MQTPLLRLASLIDTLNRRLGRLVFWLMLLMVLIGAFNAVARYAGRWLGVSLSSNAWLELQWYLFSVVFLLGSAYTLMHNAHVRVDVLYDRLPARARAWINIVGHVVFLLPFCLFVIWMSGDPVVDSFRRLEVSPDPGGLPRYAIKVFIPIAFAALFLQGVAELIKQVAALRAGAEAGRPPREDRP